MTIRICTICAGFALAVGFAVYTLGLAPALANHVGSGQSTSGQMPVTASIPVSCALRTNPLSFGTYDPGAPAALQAKTTADVVCPKGAPWEVEYDNGLWSAGDCFTRRLADPSGSFFLTYMIFNNDVPAPLPALGLVAQLPLRCEQQKGTGTGFLQQNNILGEIGPGQFEPPAVYSDTIVVTLHF